MLKEVNYEVIKGDEIRITCPICKSDIYGYESTIKNTRDDWNDGYMHFVCRKCGTELKVK